MSEVGTKKMHLPLSLEMHARLKREAVTLGVPTTALAREAIEQWLERRRRERIAVALRDFAEAHAGSELDLEEEIEASARDAMAGGTP